MCFAAFRNVPCHLRIVDISTFTITLNPGFNRCRYRRRLQAMPTRPIVTAWPDDFGNAGGDVTIRFSKHLSGTLIFHCEVLARHWTYFKTLFSPPWCEKKVITHASGVQKEI